MSLTSQTNSVLANMAPFRDELHDVSLEHRGQRLECRLTALDSLACAFERLSLVAPVWQHATIDQLRQVSEQLAAKLNYLLEPIRPVEFDSQGCTVQLRSNPPRREEDRTSYYELLVRRGGEISLCRYAKQPGDARRVIAAQVTREVFERLVDDFSATAEATA